MPQQTTIAPVTSIDATDRKESAYDSEVITGTGQGLPASITLFQNFSGFQVAGTNAEAKQRNGRDTNLGGPGGGLPQGYQLLWFEWRAGPRTLGADLSGILGAGVFEQLERIRENGFIRAKFTQSPLITANLRDLVSFTDARFLVGGFAGFNMMAPCIAERGGKVIVSDGQPYKIVGLEQLEVEMGWPGAAAVPAAVGGALAALVPYYAFSALDGVKSLN
jgi:hypothetical protein